LEIKIYFCSSVGSESTSVSTVVLFGIVQVYNLYGTVMIFIGS